jgi:hypothetical protein
MEHRFLSKRKGEPSMMSLGSKFRKPPGLCRPANWCRLPRFFFFFNTSHNAPTIKHSPGAPIFKGKVPFSRRPSIRLDRRLAPFDKGFYYASDFALLGGVSSLFIFLPFSGGGGAHRPKSMEML